MKHSLSGKNHYYLFTVMALCVMAIGLFFRFYRLGWQELWYDELFSTVSALEPTLEGLFSNWLTGDGNPPGYNVFLWAWLKLFPATETFARLPSAMAGSAALTIFYLWGRKFLSRQAVLIGTILFSLSYGAIYYAQEARGYGLLMLMATIATFLLLELIRHFPDKKIFRKYLMWYFLSLLAMSYVHYFGILYGIILTSCLGMVCIYRRKNMVPLVIGCLAWVIGYLPALPNLLLLLSIDNAQWPVYGLDVMASYLRQLFFTRHAVSRSVTVIIIAGLLIVMGLKLFRRIKRDRFKTLFQPEKDVLYYLFALSMVALLLLPVLIRGVDYRHFLVFFPLHFLVSGKILAAFPIRKFAYGSIYAILFLSMLAFGFQMRNYYQVHKQQWGTSAKYVLERYHPRAAVVVLGVHPEKSAVDIFDHFYMRNLAFYDYYFQRINTGTDTIRLDVLRPGRSAFEKYLQELEASRKNELFILGPHHLRLDQATKDLLDEKAVEKQEKQFYSTVVYGYRLRP